MDKQELFQTGTGLIVIGAYIFIAHTVVLPSFFEYVSESLYETLEIWVIIFDIIALAIGIGMILFGFMA
jgi:hypothetical protein